MVTQIWLNLAAPSHYLNQCWLIISKMPLHRKCSRYLYLMCIWKFMMTSSNGNIFRVTGHLSEEFTSLRWIPCTKASDAELWCFLDLHPNKLLSIQLWGLWFDMPSHPLWCHRNLLVWNYSCFSGDNELTHCDLMIAYNVMDLCQHLFRL